MPHLYFHLPTGIVAVIGVVITSAVIGGFIAYSEIAWLGWIVLPILTVLVIVPPIWMLFGIGTRGIDLGPRWRFFGTLGLSMTIGPLVMIVLEMILLLGILIAGAGMVYVQQPALFQEILDLGNILKLETNEEVILKLLAPYISNPLVLTTVIGYIALAVPMMETWQRTRRRRKPFLKLQCTSSDYRQGPMRGFLSCRAR